MEMFQAHSEYCVVSGKLGDEKDFIFQRHLRPCGRKTYIEECLKSKNALKKRDD